MWRNLVHERNCHRKHWERQTTIGSRSRNAKQFFLFLTLRSHCYWCRRPAAVGAIGEISSDHCCALFSFADHSVVGETSLAQANPTERLQMASAQLTLLTRVLRKIYSVHILACDFCSPGRLCAAAYVHNSQAFTAKSLTPQRDVAFLPSTSVCNQQDCTAAANPDGVSGREWCYVEVRSHPRSFVLNVSSCMHALSTTPGSSRQFRTTEMGLLRTQDKLC